MKNKQLIQMQLKMVVHCKKNYKDVIVTIVLALSTLQASIARLEHSGCWLAGGILQILIQE